MLLEIGRLAEELVSDQGSGFLNAIVSDLMRLLKVRKIDTSAYHPQSNGVAERMNSRIMAALTAWVNKNQTDHLAPGPGSSPVHPAQHPA